MPPKSDAFVVKAILMLVSTLTVMAGATIAPALPAMQDHFVEVRNGDYWVRLVLTVPAICIAIGAPFVGAVIDRFGRKPLLSLAVLLYGLAGSSGFFLNSLGIILLGRALLGLSVAGIMTTATTLIADYYTGPTRARFLGLQAGFMGLGGVVFLSFGGILADISWRKPFLIYLVALGLLPLIVLLLPEPKQEIVSTSGGSTPVAEPDRFPWGLMSVTYGIAVISQTIFYLIPVQLPFFLKALVNATAAQSGLAIALCTFFSSISAVLYQQVKARLSFMTIYAIAFLLIWGGFWGIGFANAYGPVLLSLAFAGLGLGLLMPNMNVCLTSVAPTTLRGRVLGGLTTSFFLGQFLSPLFSQPLSQVVGLGNTYILSGGLLLIMALLAFASTLRWT